MGKRFTDTNKYKKPFIRGLQGAYKLLWDFLYHDCDHAGIWIVDFETAQLYIGKDMPVNEQDALKFFNEEETRIVRIDKGKKWFIPSFIDFQYGKLSEKNRAHLSVITILLKYQLIDSTFQQIINKPLTSPLQGGKDKEQDKDKEMDTVKDKVAISKELFGDEIFIEQLKIAHKGKDLNEAFEECYTHHSNAPNPPRETWEWRQKLNTWLSIKGQNNDRTGGKKSTGSTRNNFSGDYREAL